MKSKIQQIIDELGLKPDFILKSISADEIMKSEDVEYNPQEAEKKLNMYSKNDAKFYYMDSKNYKGLKDFFVLYELDGFKMFTELSLFSSCMHNGGFREANIWGIDGEISVHFSLFNGKRAENNQSNRKIFSQNKMTITDL
jgi:NH3-dependent NAD+ synthetase